MAMALWLPNQCKNQLSQIMAQSSTSLKRKHSEMQSIPTANDAEAPQKKQKRDCQQQGMNDADESRLTVDSLTHGVTSYGLTKRQQRKQERSGFSQTERNTFRRKQKLEKKRKRNKDRFESMTQEEKEKHFKEKQERRMLKEKQKEFFNQKLIEASANGMKVCVDLYFNREFHKDMEYTNVTKQLCYCWNANKLAKHSVSLHLLAADQHWNKYLQKQGIVSWKGIHIHSQTDVLQCFPDAKKRHFVYLSPDSDVVLDEKEFEKKQNIYIIGGIVDRVIRKDLTINRAKALGIRHCKLPLHRLKGLEGRHCLNVNAVFKMLVRFQNTDEQWDHIMEQEIPNRNKPSTKPRKQRRNQKGTQASKENDANEDTKTV
eukprot:808753_1